MTTRWHYLKYSAQAVFGSDFNYLSLLHISSLLYTPALTFMDAGHSSLRLGGGPLLCMSDRGWGGARHWVKGKRAEKLKSFASACIKWPCRPLSFGFAVILNLKQREVSDTRVDTLGQYWCLNIHEVIWGFVFSNAREEKGNYVEHNNLPAIVNYGTICEI